MNNPHGMSRVLSDFGKEAVLAGSGKGTSEQFCPKALAMRGKYLYDKQELYEIMGDSHD